MMAAPSLALLRIMAARAGHPWTLMELQAAAADLDAQALTEVLQWLRLQRLIRRSNTQFYTLTPAGASLAAAPAVTAPKIVTSDLRSLVWRALRMQGKASASELLDVIGKAATRSAKQSVRTYLNDLAAVGVVAVSRFKTATGERLYQLRRDLGPAAPALQQGGGLIDMNNGQPLVPAEVPDAAA